MDRFYEWAKQENSSMEIWKDDKDGINDHLNDDMATGIQDASVVVVFLSDAYCQSKNCNKEITYAKSLEKEIIIVKLEEDVELLGRGDISLIANTKLCVSIVLIVLCLLIFRLSSTITKTNSSSAL